MIYGIWYICWRSSQQVHQLGSILDQLRGKEHFASFLPRITRTRLQDPEHRNHPPHPNTRNNTNTHTTPGEYLENYYFVFCVDYESCLSIPLVYTNAWILICYKYLNPTPQTKTHTKAQKLNNNKQKHIKQKYNSVQRYSLKRLIL